MKTNLEKVYMALKEGYGTSTTISLVTGLTPELCSPEKELQVNWLQSITIPEKVSRIEHLGGQTIEFGPGLNIIIGENGIGKSTLLEAMSRADKNYIASYKISPVSGQINTRYFDTEKMNPRVKGLDGTPASVFAYHVMSHFKSHGESILPIVLTLEKEDDGITFLIDEPEAGISIWNQQKILEALERASKGKQIILTTHSIVFMSANFGRLIFLSEKGVEYCDPPSSFDWRRKCS